MNPRIFTIEETNAMLTQLNSALIRLQETKKQVDLKQVEIDLMEIVNAGSVSAGSAASNRTSLGIDQLNAMVGQYTQIFEEIESWGPVIKDVDVGLIDFYHVRDRQLVFLCWKQGEPRVEHWHDLESGFPGRQPL